MCTNKSSNNKRMLQNLESHTKPSEIEIGPVKEISYNGKKVFYRKEEVKREGLFRTVVFGIKSSGKFYSGSVSAVKVIPIEEEEREDIEEILQEKGEKKGNIVFWNKPQEESKNEEELTKNSSRKKRRVFLKAGDWVVYNKLAHKDIKEIVDKKIHKVTEINEKRRGKFSLELDKGKKNTQPLWIKKVNEIGQSLMKDPKGHHEIECSWKEPGEVLQIKVKEGM